MTPAKAKDAVKHGVRSGAKPNATLHSSPWRRRKTAQVKYG